MKLLVCLITYNRLEYTKRTIRSFRDTVQLPYYFVAVDNNSNDGTKEYLKSLENRGLINKSILNPDNYYPGKACNIGWTEGLKDYDATHLVRLDNDMEFEKGWDLKAQEYFEGIDRLGQLGLDFDGGENKAPILYNGLGLVEWPGCVGGPNILKRAIFDYGIKYDESRWDDGRKSKAQEDSKLSKTVKEKGYLVGHMDERLSYTFAVPENWNDYPEYYKKTMTDRGYDERLEEAGL